MYSGWEESRAFSTQMGFVNSSGSLTLPSRRDGLDLSFETPGQMDVTMVATLGMAQFNPSDIVLSVRTLNKRRSQAPNPPEYRETGTLTPIDTFAHLTEPIEDEASCLILNITIPPVDTGSLGSLPVMFYIHGGS